MESDKQHFRHILLFYYRKGKNAVQVRKKLTDVYGEGVLSVRQYQNWFAKFGSGNFDVEDTPRLVRLVEADKDAIKALVDANRRITIREIRLKLNISNSTVYDYKRHENDPFLKRIITGDDKWVVYNKVKYKKSWSKKDQPAKPFPKPIFTKKGDVVCLVGY